MALTPSTMLALGSVAPDFSLQDLVSLKSITLKSFENKNALLVMFICKHCPYVVHVKDEIAKIGRDYQHKSLGIVAISSNDAQSYPEDAPDKLKSMALELGFGFPLCYDQDQSVAKAYQAACTPDFFVYDAHRKLVYRGQLDDARPGNANPITGKDLREALDSVLENKGILSSQKPSLGCNIKWKKGNEPAYFNR